MLNGRKKGERGENGKQAHEYKTRSDASRSLNVLKSSRFGSENLSIGCRRNLLRPIHSLTSIDVALR